MNSAALVSHERCRAAALMLLASALLSACGRQLWGDYGAFLTPSPTPSASPTVTASPSPTASATLEPSPTASATVIRPSPSFTPLGQPTNTPPPGLEYLSQSGDSLEQIAAHFGVAPEAIYSPIALPSTGFLDVGTPLVITGYVPGNPTSPSVRLLPDSEVIDSPTTVDFDLQAYVRNAGGKLLTYREYLPITNWTFGPQSVQRLAVESSTNPRLLLAFIQYYSGWVQGASHPGLDDDHPLGYQNSIPGLYGQMRLLVYDLAAGYYGWRSGKLTHLTFPDDTTLRIAPDLNAGTVALQYFFSRRLNYAEWLQAVDSETGFMALYRRMFGDVWALDRSVGPLIPSGLTQPEFSLPFEAGYVWSLTGGPHSAWEQEKVFAALDFAPAMYAPGCGQSDAWAVAVAPGLIVRSEAGYVLLDLDGDGYEQTGWVVLYLHMATRGRIQAGTWVDAGDRIGHPSCEGGLATGTHLHIARKYNGEWIGAGGPLPFVLGGWTAHYGSEAYFGTLTRGGQVIISSNISSQGSNIIRQPGE